MAYLDDRIPCREKMEHSVKDLEMKNVYNSVSGGLCVLESKYLNDTPKSELTT